jgi:hypothetical protein
VLTCLGDGLAGGIKFSDIYDSARYNVSVPGGCPEGFKSINSGSTNAECLKLKVSEVATISLDCGCLG